MPQFRKLSPAEIPAPRLPSAHAQIAQSYDTMLADFAVGEYGRADLDAGEPRQIVRQRLHAAAKRRGLALADVWPGRATLSTLQGLAQRNLADPAPA